MRDHSPRVNLFTIPFKKATQLLCGFLLSAGVANLQAATVTDEARRIDDHPGKSRVLVLTDIGNEPDDQMSLVRFVLYANEMDVEGIVATTSNWQKEKVSPELIHQVLDGYGEVLANLSKHDPAYPSAEHLKSLVQSGQPGFGMAAVGKDKLSPGARLLIEAADRDDPRPLWVPIWGGANTLAQALVHLRDTRPAAEVAEAVAKLRVYSISDQDDAGPWIRQNFPDLFYIVEPSAETGEEYTQATWTGISGDRMYRNGAGADFTTVTNEWLAQHIRSKGPLGKRYPHYHFIMEGDTPSFLNLVQNGLASQRNPGYGGWGGRYVYRKHYGEHDPMWTQGGSTLRPTQDSRDTVVGSDGNTYTSDQATIWRWREAFQHDFAARMDWTILPPDQANHRPEVVVNGEAGVEPLRIAAKVGKAVVLDAKGTRDGDGNGLSYQWFYYREAGFTGPLNMDRDAWAKALAQEEPWRALVPGPLVDLADASEQTATVTPLAPGEAHVILAVMDDGEPSLTAYRRVIFDIAE